MRNVLLAICGAVSVIAALAGAPPASGFHWPAGKRVAVSLSFDDARASQMPVGVPLFDRYDVKVTFYVNPRNATGQLAAWRQAVAHGHEIGNHTDVHPCTGNFAWSRDKALENYTLATMAKELDDTSAKIEQALGVKPRTFAYPCGQKFVGRGAATRSYVPLVAGRFLAGRGFYDEATNDPAFCDLAQVQGTNSDGLDFEHMKKIVEDAASQNRWVVFAGHEIGEGGDQTTRVDVLEKLLQYAKDPVNGVWLAPVAEIAAYVHAQATPGAGTTANPKK